MFYRAEVRTITTEARAFTAYTEAQVRLYFSITGRQLPSLYSAWAVSRRRRPTTHRLRRSLRRSIYAG